MLTSPGLATYPRSFVFPVDAVPVGASHYVINGAVAAHRHLFVEIAVILGGSGQHVAENGVYSAQVGDVFVIHPGMWHAYEECQQCMVANCYFGAELFEGELAWTRQDSSLAPLLHADSHPQLRAGHATTRLPADACARYRSLLDLLVTRTQDLQPTMRVECLGLLTAALGILAQSLEPPTRINSPLTSVMHPAVLAAQQMLEERLEYPWRLVELAYQLHIDRSYLVRLFKQHTGLAPMTFLAHRRAARAAVLLRTTTMPIGEIGSAVGWDDPNQFNRRFKAFYGMNASTYRTRGGTIY